MEQQVKSKRQLYCHQCKYQFDCENPDQFNCGKCNGDFCEELLQEQEQENQEIQLQDDPRNFVPYGEEQQEQQQENNNDNQQQQNQNFNNNNNNNVNQFQFPQQLFNTGTQQNQPRVTVIRQTGGQNVQIQSNFGNGDLTGITGLISNILGNVNGNNLNNGRNRRVNILGGGLGGLQGLGGLNLGSLFGSLGGGNFEQQSFENILDMLMRNDPNEYGTPPANQQAVDSLQRIKYSPKDVEYKDCSVCKEDFKETEDEVIQMPCKHGFHNDCILPWLKQHNSCPVCRYELPTDDEDYEQRKQQMQQQQEQQQQQNQNQNNNNDNNNGNDDYYNQYL